MKRRIFAALMGVVIIFGAAACEAVPKTEKLDKEQAETVREKEFLTIEKTKNYDSYWSEEHSQVLASVTQPGVRLSKEDAKEYQQLAVALEEMNKEKQVQADKEFEELCTTAKEDIEMVPEFFIKHEYTADVTVRRADKEFLSLLYDGYYYLGGVHGMNMFWGENFDVKTGKKLALEDVLTDMGGLPQIVREQLERHWSDVEFYDTLDLEEFFAAEGYTPSWTLDYNGVTIYFNPYDIAPYAYGMQSVTLSFEEYPDLFKEEYTHVPLRYAVELSLGVPYFVELTDRGTMDRVAVYSYPDENEFYESRQIEVNDNQTNENIDAWDVAPMLLHTTEGKTFLYIQDSMQNAYYDLAVYDVSHGDIRKVDVYNCGYRTLPHEDAAYYPTIQVITDPDDFMLDTHTEVLSTQTGHAMYSIGKDGRPVSETDWFVFDNNIDFTFRQPIDAILIEEDGAKIGEITIETGTKAEYFRTDGETYGDLRLPDGSIARVMVERRDWMPYINGIPAEDVLDGMIFAG